MTSPPTEIIQLGIGDTIPIGQVMANIILMGIVTDINNPNMFAATMEAFQNQAVLTIPVLQGPKGDKGDPTFALQWQNDNKTNPSQLPTNLGNTVADLGKFWIFGVVDELGNTIATTMYVWWGTALGWKQLPVGAPGPPGPYPVITPLIILEVPGTHLGPGGADSWVKVTGSASSPQFEFHIAAPQGVMGPSAALSTCPDVTLTDPQPGDVLTCTAQTVTVDGVTYKVWKNLPPKIITPAMYTIPEAAFTSALGIGSAPQQVCTFPVPPQAGAWKPWITGQMQIFGANISLTPLLVGAEVRLGNPSTGPIVARGFGNSLGYVTLIPHTSDGSNPSAAMTPTNAYGKVNANHTGTQGTLYVNLVNQGMAGVYDFHSANAQLNVLALGVPT